MTDVRLPQKRSRRSLGFGHWSLGLGLPLVLWVAAYPYFSVWLFKMREPTFAVPLAVEAPLQIRKDPYGSGEFGAHRSGGRRHRGVDLTAPVGTEVWAAKSGRVAIGRLKNGLGRYVEVHHPDGWRTRYAHLNQIAVRDGQRIGRGQLLGTVGKTGNARRRLIQSHLHFEVWDVEGVPVDPLTVIEIPTDEPNAGS